MSDRVRPQLHFTAERGWVNDPCGVVWNDGEYHLFFQYVPGKTSWDARCHWGHATSSDLVRWRWRGLALVPDGELGCWSGSAVVADGELQLFYTRAVEDRLALGDVMRARPNEGGGWRGDPAEPVVPAPGGVWEFRDPCVLRAGDHWVMVVGATLDDGAAAALGYSSDDLVGWESTGVLCRRAPDDVVPVWTGSMWECPHLFRLGDVWVLLVSVWHERTLYGVVAATGRFQDGRFDPERWQQLTCGETAYAMASFEDRHGRRCVIAWLRERNDHMEADSAWTGALSLPYLVSLEGEGELVLRPHPDVIATRRRLVPLADALQLVSFEIVLDGVVEDAIVRLRAGRTELFAALARDVRSVIVDSDVVEVAAGARLTVARVPNAARLSVDIDGHAASVWCWELSTSA